MQEQTKSAELEQKAEQLSAENSRLEELCQEHAETISRLQSIAEEKERLMDELYSLREQLTASKQTTTIMLRGAVDEFNQERMSLDRDLERLRAERDNLHQTNMTLMSKVQSSKSELSTMRQTLTDQADEAARTIEAANRSKKQIEEQLGFEVEKLSSSCARLDAELRDAEQRFQKELSAARAKFDDVSYAKNKLEGELNEVGHWKTAF